MSWLTAVAKPPAVRATKTPGTQFSNPSSWLVDLLGGPDSATGIRVTQDSALTSAAVWSAVRIISETIASFPLEVYRTMPNGRQLVPTHPLYYLLHTSPNPEMTSMEWRETSMGHLLLWGNSYTAIERDEAFRPIALWPLRPDRMQVWRDPETHRLTYTYSLWQGGTAVLDPIDVVHVRTLSRDGILGMSPVGEMREPIGLGLGLERYGAALYGNGANPGGVISVPGELSKDARENLRRSWEEQHRGPGNVGRTAVLEQGVTWQATGMKPEDAQFLLSRTFSLQEIARIWRLPPHKMGDLSNASFTNIESQNSEFVSDCLLPYLIRWEQRMALSLFQGIDLRRMFVRHTVDHLLRGEKATRYAAYAQGRQWGWLSANEVRAMEDMNPLADGQGGDDYLVPANMLPADEAGETQLPAPQQQSPQLAGPEDGGLGGHSPTKQMAQDAAQRLLAAFLEDAARRIVAREDADISRAARAARFRRDRAAFERWLDEFAEGHRTFVVRAVLPALREVAPEHMVETLAAELAEREVQALLQVVRDLADLAGLEARLARWREERPLQLVAEETPRLGLLPPPVRRELPAPAPAPPVVHVHNQQAPVPDVHVEAHVEPPITRIEPGAVQVITPPVEVHQGDTHVTVLPPPPAEVNVDVTAPPVHVEQGDTHVTVQPAEVRAGDVHVDVQPPPPAPAPSVTVENHPAAAPDVQVDVNVAPAEVRVENRLPEPPPAPRPRLERARERLEKLENGLRSAEKGPKTTPNRQKPRQNRPRRGRRR